MFGKRLVSGIILVILAAFILIQGGPILFFVSLGLSLIGLFELYRVLKIEKELPGAIGYLAVLAYYLILWTGRSEFVTFLAVALVLCLMTVYVFTFPKYQTEHIMSALFGVFYVGVLLSFVYQVRSLADGKYLVWLTLLSSWGCDTCAYCVGMLFGKHKLAPKLSPKKSVEGAVGGVAGAAILGLLYGMFCEGYLNAIVQPGFTFACACAIGAVISQIGDLAASAIKRNHDIKDYGNLIPGHGGIMDRFDSMIFTAPAIYFAILFVGMM
ncbi:MAG: phosphatidate cytidylyltransferase [Lachnospiraceae bacterium]|nr:phosphatidate cytidylyltransferase [Lachnospiraceae bacterium]